MHIGDVGEKVFYGGGSEMAGEAPIRTVDMNDLHWNGTAFIHIYMQNVEFAKNSYERVETGLRCELAVDNVLHYSFSITHLSYVNLNSGITTSENEPLKNYK